MSKHKLSGKALVIQITREEIRIARMTLGSNNPKILDRTVLPTPAGTVEDGELRNLDALRALLEPVVKEKPYRGCRQVVFLLCSTKIISESALVPEVKSERRLRQLLESNMDVYFPVASNEYQMTWKPAGREQDGGIDMLRVQIWAVPRQMLSRYYLLANSMGLTVAAVDFFGHSLVNAVDASYYVQQNRKKKKSAVQEADESLRLYIHAENELLLLTTVRNGQVAAQRFLLRGSSLQEDLNELEMLLDYFSISPGAPGLEEASISGASCGEDDLVSGISELICAPVQPILCDDGPEWLLFQGAAMTELDFGDPEMNHLTGSSRPIRRAWQYGLILAGGLALTASVILTMNAKLTWNTQLDGLRSTLSQLKILSAQNEGSGERYNTYSKLYDNYSRDWDVVFNSVRTYNDNLEKILGSLETALPKDATVTKMSIAEQGIAVQVAFEEKEDIAYFLLTLRHEPYMALKAVSNLRIGPPGEGDDGDPGSMLAQVYGQKGDEEGSGEDADGKKEDGQETTDLTGLDSDALKALTGNAGSSEAPPTEGSYSLDALLPSGTSGVDVSQVLSLAMAVTGKDTLDAATLRQALPYLKMVGVSSDVIEKAEQFAAVMETTGMTISASDISALVGQASGSTTGGATSGNTTTSGGSTGSTGSSSGSSGSSSSSSGSKSSGSSSGGSSSSSSSSSGGTITLDELELALQYLTGDQLDALQEAYGPEQEQTYTLSSLLRSAGTSQQKKAIQSLLENDASAMYKFFLLMREDLERDEDDQVLLDLIWDDVWENPDMIGMLWESDQELLDTYLPELITLMTKNSKNLAATEDLIQEDKGLSDKLAVHLAKELKKISVADTALDLNQLRRDYNSGAYLKEDEAVIDAVQALMMRYSSSTDSSDSDSDGMDALLRYLILQQMLDQIQNQNTNPGTGIADIFNGQSGGQTEPADTRYYMTFVLGYDESLIQAEQVRKGLDRDARVEKVEVAE